MGPPPEINTFEKKADDLYQEGVLTWKDSKHIKDAPLFMRAIRGRLIGEMRGKLADLENLDDVKDVLDDKTLNKLVVNKRREIREEAVNKGKEYNKLYKEFLERKKFEVEVNGGVASAEWIKLNQDAEGEPIVLISGIGSDIIGIASLSFSLAHGLKRPVYVLAYPDVEMGQMDRRFGLGVLRKGVPAYADFFNKGIKEIMGKEKSFDFVGYSLGGLIGAHLLNDPEMQKRVGEAYLVNPIGMEKNNAFKTVGILNNEKKAAPADEQPYFTEIVGNRIGKNQSLLTKMGKMAIQGFVGLRSCQDFGDMYKSMKVKNNGTITIVYGENDDATNVANVVDGPKGEEMEKANPQLRKLKVPGRQHFYPMTKFDV